MQLIDCNFCSCSKSRGRYYTKVSGFSRKRACMARTSVFPPTQTSALHSISSQTANTALPYSSTRGPNKAPGGEEPLLSRKTGRTVEAEPFPSRSHNRAAPPKQNHVQLELLQLHAAPGCQLCTAAPSETSAHTVQEKQGTDCQLRVGLCIFLLLWTIYVTM